jgi:type I restriction enzyme R subunit
VNDALAKRMQARKMLTNASYFAFTATPKNKTLEMFGEPLPPDAEGKVKHRPFHSYTMKQAIQEGFILDVLKSYTPVDSYYKLVKKIEDDPEFDTKKAQKKLRKYVESHDHAIRLKAEIMVDHFHEQVMAEQDRRTGAGDGGDERHRAGDPVFPRLSRRISRSARARIRPSSPSRASTSTAGAKVSEASLNGFPSGDIADKIQEDPYRFLICADKFQTGYDEPLLHTMYVDKPLSGIKAVQTLSRLNRAHPQKHDCFVLDFQNNTETITFAFQDYYRTTVLSEETDPNKLHDLKAALDNAQVYSPEQVQHAGGSVPGGADRDKLDPILDACVAVYKEQARRGRPGGFQGQGQDVLPHLRLPFLVILPYTTATGRSCRSS